MLNEKNLQLLGTNKETGIEVTEINLQISKDLGNRSNLLQDTDGHLLRLCRDLQSRTMEWTDFPEEDRPGAAHLRTYIINCPRLHALTAVTLERILRSVEYSTGLEV